ncbi:helix-turn-helix domain-containing protein [Phragmitibacter flavus]|uniref:Helix-turn-helix domain-containing protein n=1 Tax=Phragmitibacter flavus TaxID=2576071 RepID=A0A5R8K944_9BACT|nr:DNA-binding transcriptional regulator [Phragmitibacter flavus]TLD68836.1 helix-turn-helix domain-containing protein [Phragmitibacter flavus]
MAREKIPQIAVLVDTSRSYGRDIVQGIRRYATEHGPWSLFLEPRDLMSQFPKWLEGWSGDGILARSGSAEMLSQLEATGLPVVELRTTSLKHGFPFVGMDNRQMGERVAGHLRSRGFQRFAGYLDPSERYFLERMERFVEVVNEEGFGCPVFEAFSPSREMTWDEHQRALADWLVALEKPVGVFACSDQLGFWLLDAARRAGILVPEQVAVVGAENDSTLCETAWPPLSSVQFRGQAVGFAAAELLAEWMKSGKKEAPRMSVGLPTGDIVVRQSSEIVAVEDEQLARALFFIREHAAEGIGVKEVARAACLSRSVLERRMMSVLGRSPGEEINRVKFRLVENLLAQSDLTLAAIAERAGFEHPQYMAEAFKRRSGMTPGEFRKRRKI